MYLFFKYAGLCLLSVTPHTQCRLKLLKQERIKDYLLMEEEFIRNQEQMKPLEEKQEVSPHHIRALTCLRAVYLDEMVIQ